MGAVCRKARRMTERKPWGRTQTLPIELVEDTLTKLRLHPHIPNGSESE